MIMSLLYNEFAIIRLWVFFTIFYVLFTVVDIMLLYVLLLVVYHPFLVYLGRSYNNPKTHPLISTHSDWIAVVGGYAKTLK